MTQHSLPSFCRPPVVETVLGIQFERLKNFHNAHQGLFWQRLGVENWPHVEDAPPLDEQFEKFDHEKTWGQLGGRLTLSKIPVSRSRFRNPSQDRMVQIQNGCLHLNWLGQQGGKYPRYSTMREEFEAAWRNFASFVESDPIGQQLQPNQWEVTYVNHIPKDLLWEQPTQWGQVLPGLLASPTENNFAKLESMTGEWHFQIPNRQGRLHAHVQHGRPDDSEQRELLILRLTARGPIPEGYDLADGPLVGLDTGHKAIVRTFADVTSERCHRHWERDT